MPQAFSQDCSPYSLAGLDNHTNTSSACESLPGIVVFIPHTRRLYLYWLDHSRMRPSSSNSCKERPRRVTRRGLSIIFGLSHQPDQQLEADEQDRLVQQIDEYGMPPHPGEGAAAGGVTPGRGPAIPQRDAHIGTGQKDKDPG